MSHLIITNRPIQGIDSDSDDHAMGPEDYRDGVNIRNSYAYLNQNKTGTGVKGNVLVSYNLGGIVHKSLGSCQDLEGMSIVFFLWAADNKHKILRYFPNKVDSANPNGIIDTIMIWDFKWKRDTKITQNNIATGKQGALQYWIDNTGLHKINLTKASLYNKFKSWTVYLPKNFTRFQDRFFFVINPMGSTTPIRTMTIDTTAQPQITSIGLLFAYLADAINADSVAHTYITAKACDCELTLTERKVNTVDVFFLASDIKTVPENWYGTILFDRYFAQEKWPPVLSPIATFGIDATKKFNNIKNRIWQFRLQYQYDDYEQSKLGPDSQVPINETINDGLQIDIYNYLNINFNDADIDDVLTILKKIAVLARIGNTDQFRRVAILDICDFLSFDYGLNRWYCDYNFFNNTQSSAITTELNDTEFDVIPIEAYSQRIVENRMVTGGPKENYDPVECPDMKIKIDFTEAEEKYYNVIFNIRIYNFRGDHSHSGFTSDDATPNQRQMHGVIAKYPATDPDNPTLAEKWPQWGGFIGAWGIPNWTNSGKDHNLEQFIPMTGFTVFSRGTPFWGVSKQVLLKQNNGVLQPGNYLPLAFGSVLDATNTDNIRHFLSDEYNVDVVHTVIIRVKAGRHVFQIASHWVSFGDVLGKGGMYDMYNGLEYQTTSTHVRNVNPIVNGSFQGYDYNTKEIIVDVTNADVFAGEFVVEDCRSLNDLEATQTLMSGYVVDAHLGLQAGAIIQSPRIEYQILEMSANNGVIPSGQGPWRSVIDHNGFCYRAQWTGSAITDPDGHQNAFLYKILYITGTNTLYYTGTLTPYISTSILKALSSGLLTPATIYQARGFDSVLPPSLDSQFQLLFAVADGAALATMTGLVEGRVVDSNGSPLANAVVVLQYTGRFATTDVNGNYKLLFYSTVLGYAALTAVPHRDTSQILISFDNTTDNLVNNFQTITLADFTVYNQSNPYVFLLVTLPIQYNPYGKGLKRGGWFQLGYREHDAADRCNTVNTSEKLKFYIPFITEDLHDYYPDQYPPGTYKTGKPIITVTLNFKPSRFAKVYQLLLVENQYETNSYLVWVANQVTYVSNIGYSPEENTAGSTTLTTSKTTGGVTSSTAVTTPQLNYVPPVVASYLSGTATNIYLSLKNLIDYRLANPDSVLKYEYQAGDRIRLIADADGNRYQVLYDLEVTGFDIVQQAVIIKSAVSMPELKSGVLFEIYHPRPVITTPKQIFFEVGEAFLCTAPGQANNDFSVNPIVLTCGDTYWHRRRYIVNDTTNYIIFATSYLVEDAGLSDLFDSKYWDIGRIGLADPYFKQQRFPMGLRVSGNFVANTLINGLSSYLALDNKDDLSTLSGQITGLEVSGQVLLVIATNKVITIYLGAVLARDQAGQGLLQITQQFFGNDNPLIKDYGCQNAESIVNFNGYIYFPDFSLGIVVRYADNGLFAISSYKMRSFFQRYSFLQIWDAPAVYDKAYEEYILTIYEKKMVITNWVNGVLYAFPSGQTYPISSGDLVYIEYVSGTGETINTTATILIANGTQISFAEEIANRIGGQIIVYYKEPEGITVAFMEKKNRFPTRYSYLPDTYGIIKNRMVSFKDGQLWVHDINPLFNNFYGVQYKTQIAIVANTGESDENVVCYLAMRINTQQANQGFNWDVPNISNRQGQLSFIPRASFVHGEQYWWSEFKKDTTTLAVPFPIVDGREMRSQAIAIVLTNDFNGLFELLSIACEVMISERNVK